MGNRYSILFETLPIEYSIAEFGIACLSRGGNERSIETN
jgi:hypothetical protein